MRAIFLAAAISTIASPALAFDPCFGARSGTQMAINQSLDRQAAADLAHERQIRMSPTAEMLAQANADAADAKHAEETCEAARISDTMRLMGP